MSDDNGEVRVLRGLWQHGDSEHRVTITDDEGVLVFEDVIPDEAWDEWAPPLDLQKVWDQVDFSNVASDGEPEVRKVVTVFTVEIQLDGTVLAREDFSARYDLMRAATPADMLMACQQVTEWLRGDLVAEMVMARMRDSNSIGANGNGASGVISRVVRR